MSSGSVLQVVILRNGTLVGTEVLVPGDYRIGRSDECDLKLDEPTLSRVHARLVFNGQRVGIQDLESDNGVLINGEKVKAREVKSLDDVHLGRVTLKFKILGRKDEKAAAEKPPLERTVAIAARPTSAALRAQLESVAAPPPISMPLGLDSDVTSPGQPPAGVMAAAAGTLQATQPSARRSQVAPDLQPPPPAPMAPPPAPLPPRPVIGLVPPPSAPRAVPAPAVTDEVPAAKPAPKPPKKQAKGAPQAAVLDRTVPRAARPELVETSPTGEAEPLSPGQQPSVRARVLWGDQMVACRTFAWGEAVVAGESEKAPLPVYNFGLKRPSVLCRVHSSGWAVHVPTGAKAEIHAQRGWELTQPSLDAKGVGIVPLAPGAAVRISQGRVQVELTSLAPLPPQVFERPKLDLGLMIPLALAMAGAIALIVFAPKNLDSPDFVPRQLPALRAALVPPAPKPKPPPKQKEEKVAEKKAEAPKKPAPKVAKAPAPHRVAPQKPTAAPPPAIAALAKLTSNPAMSHLLSATNKISGGGRPNGLKMVGLKGIGPVALAGSSVGQGGGFGGGPVTGGRELLGKGIGAIGVKHALKGSPGGVVAQAPSRQAKIHGSMSREEIAKVVNAHMQQIRACYERTLLRDPGLAGKLVLEWTINASGAVAQFKTKTSSLKNPQVAECILDNMKSWRFPRPTGGGQVVVSYPFIFNSVGF